MANITATQQHPSIFTLPDLYIDTSTGKDTNIEVTGNRDTSTDVAQLQKIVQCSDETRVARLGKALLRLYALQQSE